MQLAHRNSSVRTTILASLTLLVALPANPAEAQQQWRRWEQVFTSQQDYTVNSAVPAQAVGNPYRDLILTATFTHQATGQQFRRHGFWDGGRTFKIRGAFPPGIWSWSTTCSGTTAGKSCGPTATSPGDPGLTMSGTISVSGSVIGPSCTPGPTCYNQYELYNRGFPAVSADGRFLTYAGGTTPFFWSADTAWQAPVLATSSNWQTYVADRLNKGFTAVLIGLAPDWSWTNPTAFQQTNGCSSADPVPNACSRWLPSYWQAFDDKVQQANQAGLVAVIVGLNDPMDRGGSAITPVDLRVLYPRQMEIEEFSRNLAARMAGNFVIYSGAFDDRRDVVNPNSAELQENVMKAALAALFPSQPANPYLHTRQLKSIHLNGGASYADYAAFQSVVDVQLFHSGHGKNGCNSPESLVACALRRAREMPLALGNYSSGAPAAFATLRPSGNVETLYESDNFDSGTDCVVGGTSVNCLPQEPDTPNRVRQASHLTSLSGSFGSTIGVGHSGAPWPTPEGIFPWVFGAAPNDFGSYLATPGAGYMQNLRALFASRPWKDLRPQHCSPATATCGNLILTAGNDTAPGDQREVIAVTTNWRYAIAYMPNNANLVINTGSFPSFSTRWTKTWWDPRAGGVLESTTPNCTGSACTFNRPRACPGNSGPLGSCDWALILEDTCPTCANSTASSLAAKSLRVGLGRQDGGTQLGIVAQLEDPDGSTAGPVTQVSTDSSALHKLPQVARERSGSFLVVWQSENLDGSLWGVFARRYNPVGFPLGEPFPVNMATENDQTDPAVAETAGEFVVAWTSLGQDGDLGGIFARRIRASGDPVGPEFAINTTTVGHQGFPQVAASASGDFVVAWESGDEGSRSEAIYAQRFDRFGNRIGNEILVPTPIDSFSELVTLAVEPLGTWVVEAQRYDAAGADLGRFARRFTSAGEYWGSEYEVLPPAPR
jgi:Protein of unknown function (DUF4038)/Domain of unknown function (DUF5060)